jgi:threonine aldolase
MRQAGIIAAAGIVSLEQMVERLAEDHEHCKQLAQGLADYPQIDIDVERVTTNILIFKVQDNEQHTFTEAETMRFLERAQEHSILMGHMGGGKIRAVTHYGIDEQHINIALAGIRRALLDM